MSKKIQAIRGMNDLLPADSNIWSFLDSTISNLLLSYGYKYCRTPNIESTETFARAIGEVTDIVEKEMYTWKDNNGDSLTLRPEGTAGVVRMMIEHNLPREGIQKVFYNGPMFRHERPQKGRYRQFHQVGAEVFGVSDAKIDAELISITQILWKTLGIDAELEINSLGSAQSRASYREILSGYFNDNKDQLDEDSLRRLKTNPLRILDSKNKELESLISGAPKMIDYLDDDSNHHFNALKNYLESLDISYKVNPKLVRGLDYYNQTVFEWISNDLGAQGTICGGGRYDGLVEKMGGNATPAIGFAMGLERIALLIEDKSDQIINKRPHLYFASIGDSANIESMNLSKKIIEALPHITITNDMSIGTLKNQMKKANKSEADFAMILGEQELSEGHISIKPLKGQGVQQSIKLEGIIHHLQEIL
ncbi:histidyl-tRNA synthase [Candidatus Pseudothioglobus singularis]|jgi:histidyl-tRNA synthetase|uniref:histidine--tRNA ligase n=1 Tax=Candidatus Pseudothioglobus singularis TaxID=1427364 RepID=UPI0008062E07|nr:histidine--tRNA ligase [Candidatus Pseudothioglobus singularis]ANQ66827.1 histidyl-tRNA synthase [Candidatus Pseudothioglobus singularis]MDB4846917.1 histidine--tRNA ligase [Candidatus Pseudothioglobus singularis]MDC0553333.1 histidine--tRNA ligase [Candidatus Pseudothioglobus singularis]